VLGELLKVGCCHRKVENIMGIPLYALYKRHDPFATPHWRWSRAVWLAKRFSRASERLDDWPTRRTYHFLRCLGRCQDQREQDEVRRDFPDLAGACSIYRENGNVRLELECRVLAGQTNREIAGIMSLPVPVIRTYERIFYCVRHRLHACDWVVLAATGNKFVTESGAPNIGAIARQFAFFGGPPILNMVLPCLLDGSTLSDDPLDLSTPAGRRTMRVRLAVQTMVMPTDEKTALEMLKLWLDFRPYLSPLPEAPKWNGPLVDQVPALPESVLRQVAVRAIRRVDRAEETVQHVETAEESPLLLRALSVA
jgi:hypothetical protein